MPTTSNVSHLLVVLSVDDDLFFSIDHLTDYQRAIVHEHAGTDLYEDPDDEVIKMVAEGVCGMTICNEPVEKWTPLKVWCFRGIKSVVFLLS